jgi:phosphate transport system permease protein
VVVDLVVTTAFVAAPTIVGAALLCTVVVTVAKGLPALVHANFFVHDMAGVRPSDSFNKGGIAHALIGTLIEVAIAVGIALPLGLTTAVYLAEVGGRGSRVVRTVIEAMTALPSIVAGLFIYTTLIVGLHFPSSGFAAALALSVMGLPIMARAADVVLRVVPSGLREASYSLGAGRWQTVWRVVLPTARPGLATALILGIARMVGETSPLILTSGASTFLNTNPVQNPMNSLPLFVYNAVGSGEPSFEQRGYAAATVLLVVVLTLFILARLAARTRSVSR